MSSSVNRKQANLCFHYSERLKSNLFLLSSALDRLTRMTGERSEGGKEVMEALFAALRGELNIARRFLTATDSNSIAARLDDIEGKMRLVDYDGTRECIAQAISQVTTISSKYIDTLTEEGLI